MRVILNLSESKELVPFTYKEQATYFLHNSVPVGNLHGGVSLYSFSNLRGDAKLSPNKEGLSFPYGAQIFYNFHDPKVAQLFIDSVARSPYFGFGMKVTGIRVQQDPEFEYHEDGIVFQTTSPVLVKRLGVAYNKHCLTFEDAESNAILTRILNDKAKAAGIGHVAKVQFDSSYSRPKTKLIKYKGSINIANSCPVIITGHPEILKFAWNVGVGNSTGIGFGALL